MSYTVYRVERDGTKTVVGCTGDAAEIGVIIDEDRGGLDEERRYEVAHEERGDA